MQQAQVVGSCHAVACLPDPPNYVVNVEAALASGFEPGLESPVLGEFCNEVRAPRDLIGVSNGQYMRVGETAEELRLRPWSARWWCSEQFDSDLVALIGV